MCNSPKRPASSETTMYIPPGQLVVSLLLVGKRAANFDRAPSFRDA